MRLVHTVKMLAGGSTAQVWAFSFKAFRLHGTPGAAHPLPEEASDRHVQYLLLDRSKELSL